MSPFLESNKDFLIRLHSSSDSSAVVYIRLHSSVTRLYSPSDSSTLGYIRLYASVIGLHSSTAVCNRLVTRLFFLFVFE